jgi:RTX calcium-binding nonapeptide repeat (4 copies)
LKPSLALSLALAAFAAPIAAPASAETVGSDLEALNPTKTIACPRGEACIVAQALGGNGTPFSPPTGVIASWSVKLGPSVPQGIRLVVQGSTGSGGAGAGRRTLDVGSPQESLVPNAVNTFRERLPIHADETFGVRLEATSPAGTRAAIAAPFTDEYKTLLLWDPPPPLGGPSPLATRHFENTRIAISADVVPPNPGRCDPHNTYTGSKYGDDYGGFAAAGDVIYGLGGNDSLRAYTGGDCVYGGGGDDSIAGMDGPDLLVGGSGGDEIGAGEGDDRILARDGKRDTVRCAGGRDFVKADGLDLLQGCEQIHRG